MKPFRAELRQGAGVPDWLAVIARRGGLARTLLSREISGDELKAARLRAIAKEALYTTVQRGDAHNHSTDAGGQPVVVCDLHGTLTPARGYPLSEPWPGVKEALDLLVGQGVCIHIATGALSPYHPPEVLEARLRQTVGWLQTHGLPIQPDAIFGKVPASVYVDDRMVPVPQVAGQWTDVVLPGILEQLGKRAELDDSGIWRLVQLPERGDPVEAWPDPELMPADDPRGYSTPVVDIDLHRCLLEANSSQNESTLMPGALQAVSALYLQGWTIDLSCAGWDPASKTPEESAQRLAKLRQLVRTLGVPYDLMVSKDHPTVNVDDKGVAFTDWATALPLMIERLQAPDPEAELTVDGPDDLDVPSAYGKRLPRAA